MLRFAAVTALTLTALPGAAHAASLVRRTISPEDVTTAIRPATAKDGLPESLLGVWWADLGDKSYVLSFHPAQWHADSQTALLDLGGAGVIAYASTEQPSPYLSSAAPDASHRSFEFVLADDHHSAKILLQTTDAQGQVTTKDLGWGMDLVQDGEWHRHASAGLNYNMRRIVNAQGQREAAFADYRKAVPSSVDVTFATLTLNADAKAVSVAVDPAAADLYLSIAYNGSVPVAVSATGDVPVTMQPQVVGANSVVTTPGRATSFIIPNTMNGGYIALRAAGTKAGQVAIKSAPIAEVTMSNDPSRLEVSLAPDEFKLVTATPAVGHDGFYRLSAEDAAVLDQYGRALPEVPGKATGWTTDDYYFNEQVQSQQIIVHNTSAAATTAHVSFTAIESVFVDAGTIVVDGPAVTRTLRSPTDVDRLQIQLPAGVSPDRLNLYFDNDTFKKFEGDTIDPSRKVLEVFNPMNGSNLDQNPVDLYLRPGELLSVKYMGDLEAVSPLLTYTIRLQSVPPSAP